MRMNNQLTHSIINSVYKQLLAKMEDLMVLQTAEGSNPLGHGNHDASRSGRATKPATLITKPYSP